MGLHTGPRKLPPRLASVAIVTVTIRSHLTFTTTTIDREGYTVALYTSEGGCHGSCDIPVVQLPCFSVNY